MITSTLLPLLLASWCPQAEEGAGRRAALRFQGRILDERGAPVAGAGFTVGINDRLETSAALLRPAGRTGPDGRFDFEVPPLPESPAIHGVLVAGPGIVSARWVHITWPRMAGDSPAAQVMPFGDVVLPDGVAVKGRVRGAGGRPLAGARVRAADLVSLRTSQPMLHASYAFSAADGSFSLPGVYEAGLHLCADADGHYHKTISPVDARQPLVLEMTESGFVQGRVIGPDGRPAKGYVRITYEVVHYEQASETNDDGTFRMTVRFPCRFRLEADPVGREGPGVKSEVIEGPGGGLELRLPPAPASRTVRVTAVDSRTGARIARFRASGAWHESVTAEVVAAAFDVAAKDSGAGGAAVLEAPAGAAPAGVVMVVAPGFAPGHVTGVEIEAEGDAAVEVRLEPESVIEGRVVAEGGGEALPGARVRWRLAREDEAGDRSFHEEVAGAGGSFLVPGLVAGKYELLAGHPRRPGGKLVHVELGKAERRAGLELVLPPGVVFSGRLTGAATRPGWQVRFDRDDATGGQGFERFRGMVWSGLSDLEGQTDQTGAVDVREDGSFRFEGLGRGHYALRLLMPSHPRAGPSIEVLVERTRIRGADLARDFEVSEDLPGRLAGKLKAGGAQVSPGRLIVVAEPAEGGAGRFFPGAQALAGRRGLAGEDGSFEIVVPPGSHRLRVVDLETGILLCQDRRRLEVEAGKRVERQLAFEVAEVRAELVPEGRKWIAAHLAVEPAGAQEDGMGAAPWFMMMRGMQGAPGVDLGEGPAEVSFLVPKGETKLSVRGAVEKIATGSMEENPPLGEAEVTAVPGKVTVVRIKVAPPPDVPEGEVPEGEKKE